jgi:tetratricopeptide (TPR) repeat protein
MNQNVRQVESPDRRVMSSGFSGPDEGRSSRIELLICLLLAVVTLTAFWPMRLCDFVGYDDHDYVTENLQVRKGLTWPGIVWAFKTPVSGNWHPLTILSHMLDCQCFGLDSGGHHLTSLLFHIANTLLLFGVLRQMTAAVWRSAFVAALFALHPLRVESVAWISERKDVLSLFFFMLTLWAYARYAQGSARCQVSGVRTEVSRRFPSSILHPPFSFYLLSLLFFALGLMSKPMLVTVPFVLLLLDYWPLRRVSGVRCQVSGEGMRSTDLTPVNSHLAPYLRLLYEKVPFFLLSAIISVISFRAQHSGGAVPSTGDLSVGLRVGNALISYSRYLRKTFWPDDLAVFYPYPETWPSWQVVGAGLLLTALSILVVGSARRRPYLLTGWLWFLGTLGPVIGLLQVGMQSMADRYTYIPLIGVFIMLVWLAFDFAAAARRRLLGVGAILVVALFACFTITRGQLRHWQNSETLFRHALLVTKNNHVAHNVIGMSLFLQGKTNEAMIHLQESVRLQPSDAEAQNNLGGALLKAGKTAEAVAHFQQALQINPDYVKAHNNLGVVFLRQGQTAEAAEQFNASLMLNPEDPDTQCAVGDFAFAQGRFSDAVTNYQSALQVRPDMVEAHQHLGMALVALGRPGEAVAPYQEALRLKPDLLDVHIKLGNVLLGQGKLDKAAARFRTALRLKPDYADAHNNLGMVLARKDKWDEATIQYREALRYDTNHFLAHYNLALALVRQGLPPEAMNHFLAALRSDPGHADTHFQMGNLLAAQGKFAEAISHYSSAVRSQADFPQAQLNWGRALAQQGRWDDAIAHYSAALRLKPDYGEAHNNLAIALARQGKFADAVTHFNLALQHGTEPAETHHNLGRACLGLGKVDLAIGHYRQASRLRPNWAEALNDLAWTLATRPEAQYRNGIEAMKFAERAVELTNRKDAEKLDTLAAAYAEAGRFAESVETARQAMATATAGNQPELAGQIEKRLQAFQSNQPWREP